MEWPWVSRQKLIAANVAADMAQEAQADAEIRATFADRRLADYMEGSRTRDSIAENERQALREEVKLLLDRIVQMSGQPPIFHPPSIPPTPEPAESRVRAPEVRETFDDVHQAARKAIREGKMHPLSGAN
jgi:hypothetical protein